MHVIETGDVVRVRYTTYAHGECAIESSDRRDALEFVVGSSTVVAGVNQGVLGLSVGQSRRLSFPPEMGFGVRQAEWQQTVPLEFLPENLREGDQLSVTIAGQTLDLWVRTIRNGEATLDANHPLAGESLTFDVRIEGIGDGG